MEGVLEQILAELKEIKQILAKNYSVIDGITKIQITNDYVKNDPVTNNTMKTKEAAEYLGISVNSLKVFTKQGKIKYFTIGNRCLYKRMSLDQWLKEIQDESIQKTKNR